MVEETENPLDRQAELRTAFREYESGIAIVDARRAAVFASLFMLLGWALDWVVVPEMEATFLLIRATTALLLAIIFFCLGRTQSHIISNLYAQGIALLPLLAICTMIGLTDGGNSVYYAGLNLILVGLSLLMRWTFKNSLAMILACWICYSASVLFAQQVPNFPILFSNSYFIGVTSVFVLAGSFYYERLRYTEFCLRAEVEKSKQLLESQNRQLNELDEAKTRFFANISHELRTPLTIMLGITERLRTILAKANPDPLIQEMTGMLEQNGLRLLKLIDDLLDLVRFDTGHADIYREPTLISPHFEGLLRSLRHLAEHDRVALIWECKSESGSIMLDRDKFDKILLNLVINAIKFTPSSGTIEVKLLTGDGQLRLTVEDTGVGIAPEMLPRIFERFWQVDSSTTRKFQGAGIGLALVRSLAEALGGEISVESQVGRGTTFTILIPADVVDASATPSAEAVASENGKNIASLHRRAALSIPGKMQSSAVVPLNLTGSVPSPMIGGRPSSARPLVLIADDEPDIRRFLRMQMENVDIIEASDGAEALELARLRQPQIALLDHMMPEMDGVEVCTRIRANHSTRGMSVIVLTARADEQTKLSALQAGASDFLTKPFSTAELALRLQNQIAMARIRHELIELNSELNLALEQIKENEVVMVRTEKLSALGRMSAGIIHEINNPLNYAGAGIHALGTFAKLIPQADQEDFKDILKDIREGIERVSQIVIDLRKFTRDDVSTSGPADLLEIVGRSRRMVGHQLGKDITFNLTTPEHAIINGNPNQLVQVFINFFQNSIDAIEMRIAAHGGGPGQIDCVIEAKGDRWLVDVRDNGIGIPPENLQKIFDPFFTSKDVGKGMGLGLSITHQILRSHRAEIDVESRPGEFTRFRLTFPELRLAAESSDSVLDQMASIR